MGNDMNNNNFLSFLDKTTKTILKKINIKNYFILTEDQKLTICYTVFNLLKTTSKVSLHDDDFKRFLFYLRKKNEVEENYEFASIINDIVKNFDKIINDDKIKKNDNKKKKTEAK